LVDVINTSNNHELCALITAAFISSTYKVESTHAIVDIWEKFRDNIQAKDNFDHVAALLALGRMMDIKEEMEETRYIGMMSDLFETFINDLKARGHSSDLQGSHLITALITAACISRSEKIETVNEIISQWEEMSEKIDIKDDLDKLSGILTIGRINEYKYDINNIEQILDVHKRIRDFLEESLGSRAVDQNDIAAAFLTTGYLEITPKVERIQDIVKLWEELKKDSTISDQLDYVTALLTYGRIRDLNAQYFLTDNTIVDIKTAIRNYLDTKN
jgi:hypothetical protein